MEILRTVGVDRPANMLFVTDVFQEAVAASSAGNALFLICKLPLYMWSSFKSLEYLGDELF